MKGFIINFFIYGIFASAMGTFVYEKIIFPEKPPVVTNSRSGSPNNGGAIDYNKTENIDISSSSNNVLPIVGDVLLIIGTIIVVVVLFIIGIILICGELCLCGLCLGSLAALGIAIIALACSLF